VSWRQTLTVELTDGEPGHVFQRLVVVVVLGVVDVELELGKVSGRTFKAATAVLALPSAGANLIRTLVCMLKLRLHVRFLSLFLELDAISTRIVLSI
jgi:hypothetical protein